MKGELMDLVFVICLIILFHYLIVNEWNNGRSKSTKNEKKVKIHFKTVEKDP